MSHRPFRSASSGRALEWSDSDPHVLKRAAGAKQQIGAPPRGAISSQSQFANPRFPTDYFLSEIAASNPAIANEVIRLLPPWLMNGSVTPVSGNALVTPATLSSACVAGGQPGAEDHRDELYWLGNVPLSKNRGAFPTRYSHVRRSLLRAVVQAKGFVADEAHKT